MKKCSKCQIMKDTSEFTPRKDRPGGFTSSCKKCNADYTLRRRIEFPNMIKESQKRYAVKNREKICAYKKERYYAIDKFKERKPRDPIKRKESMRRFYRKGFDIGDDVISGGHKYKILNIIPGVGYRLQIYGPIGYVIVRPRRLLTPKKVGL